MRSITPVTIFLLLYMTVTAVAFSQQPAKTSPPGASKTTAAASGTATTESSFTHACNDNINLTVTLYSAAPLKLVSVHNNQADPPVSQAGLSAGTSKDTAAKPANTAPATAPRDTLYRYRTGFDAINFVTWLKNQYPKVSDECAKYLAYRIGQEWMLLDAASLQRQLGAAESQQELVKDADKKAGQDKKAPTLHPAAAGAVAIISSPATRLQLVYAASKLLRVDTIHVYLRLASNYNADSNQVVFTSQDTSSSRSIRLRDTVITIPENEWNKALKADSLYKVILYIEVGSKQDSSIETEYTYISIAGQSQSGTHRVQLDRRVYNPSKPFWVEVGTNFDFADGLQPNNFFGGVFLYERDIRPSLPFIFKRKSKKDLVHPSNFGLFAGVFESKSVTNSKDTILLRSYYDASSLALVDTNRNPGVFRDSGMAKVSQVVKNIGLFFSPQVRITNGPANTDGLHVSVALWIELQWQRISNNIDYAGLKRRDTIHVPVGQLGQYAPPVIKPEIDIRSHYYGLGLPIFFKRQEANVFFNPTIGRTNQPTSSLIYESIKTNFVPERKWNWFYMFQFRLNEEHFGIAFTGEVRGLLKKMNPPFVSLALSKKFDLNKFLEFK